jgi:glyoxylase-like metal-dependent hydrolase (beta-lactamase superfamily II)
MNRRILLVSSVLLVAPAFAQIDLSGEWNPLFHEDQPERIPGPEIGDYLGLPVTDEARMRADAWDADILTLPEHQCKPHPSDYGPRGPANLRIWKEVDRETQQIIAWRTHISWQAPERTIWMDGRPHPPEWAPHTWQGFSTGQWNGEILTVTTTHLKAGWIRRNGVPRSDRATLTEHWIRHGDQLTLVSIVHDPVYLTEPFVRTTDFVMDLRQRIDPYPCEAVEEVDRPAGKVPHHLPGANPFLGEFPARRGIPEQAARGGPATMMPEYRVNPSSSPAPSTAAPRPAEMTEFHVLPVQGQVSIIVGGGGNSAVQAGADGVLVVDTKSAARAEDLLRKIGQLTTKQVRYIINTAADPDHTGGNETISKAGRTITGGNVARFDAAFPATVVAHEGVVAQMQEAGASPEAWPGNTYFGAAKDLFFNGEAVRILHLPAAHSGADSIVFFRRSDVIATGDLFTPDRYPVIDVARGGTINGLVNALNRLLDLTVPAEKQEGGTMVIPGHGRVCDEADVVEYRDMVTIVRDRIQDLVKKGLTLEQVKAARPTADYDPLYGSPDAFIEAAYRTLKS